jgi:ATP-dependent DNA ligase
MDVDTFWQYILDLKEASGNEKKTIIRSIINDNDSDDWAATVSFIAGEEFDNVGVAPTTMMNAIEKSDLNYTREEMEERKREHGTLTEALMDIYPFNSDEEISTTQENMVLDDFFEEDEEEGRSYQKLTDMYRDCQKLHDLSGNELQHTLATMFNGYYPPALSFGVLDDLSIGASKKTITMAAAEENYTRSQIERARAFTPDVVEFVERLEDGRGLQLEPVAGEPFDPMLAKNKDRPSDETEWVSQIKLDGHRLLIHVSEGDAKAFTRVRNDVTFSLPELDEIDWPEGEYIFDCEAVAYDDTHGNLPFSKTSQRIGRKHDLGKFDYEIRFYMFDLILNDGEDITQETQEERINQLENVAPDYDELVEVIDTDHDIDASLEQAKEDGYEGIIIKDLTEEYKFKRSNAWRKLKVTEETVDLKISEFERRQGSDADTLGGLGLETKDGHFVGYVGTGFSDAQAKDIWENQDEYIGKVVEIQFEGFDEKLRFPSFKYFREDGEPDTLEKIKKLSPDV